MHWKRTPTSATTSCSTCSPRTSAAAPAIRTSSRRCAPRATRCVGQSNLMNDVAAHGHYPIAPPASERRVLGHAVPRIEDLPLVTGRGRYAGDINFPHQLHMRIVRSPKAHGRIMSIDTSAARALPGVSAVWTNADIADLSPIDFRADKSAEGIREFRQPALAKTYVR